jgi:hypothetical protein
VAIMMREPPAENWGVCASCGNPIVESRRESAFNRLNTAHRQLKNSTTFYRPLSVIGPALWA